MIVGIDPGAGGGLALLDAQSELVAVCDMPVVAVDGKRRVAAGALADMLAGWKPQLVIIEKTGARPGQGTTSMYSFGYACGILEGVCAGLGIGIVLAHPKTWKRAMGVTADKGACRIAAQRMWPVHHERFARVRDDGRAEAALLAAYQVMQWGARAA